MGQVSNTPLNELAQQNVAEHTKGTTLTEGLSPLQQAEKDLADYVKTLSPEQQTWANNFRVKLDSLPEGAERMLAITSELANIFARTTAKLAITRASETSRVAA